MIIRLQDCPAQPWKNGLGSTRELAVHPRGAGSDDFLWRVSIAEVDSGAPFSAFPGIDRQIVLLDGSGFTMTLDGRQVHALTTPFAPFAFAGEAKVDVALAGGPTRDFNLMLRRGRTRGGISVWHGPATAGTSATTALVYCAAGTIDTPEGMLRPGDAWRPAGIDASLALGEGVVALAVDTEQLPGG